MVCKKEKLVVPYILGELDTDVREAFLDHIRGCEHCGSLVKDLQDTEQIMAQRRLPQMPAGLLSRCLGRIREQEYSGSKASVLSRFRKGFTWRHIPVWQWASFIIIFCAGLGIGKLFFDTPTWLQKYHIKLQSNSEPETVNKSRYLKNYLLSVETLFLDLSNMEDPSLIGSDEWKMELEIARGILKRTRQIKQTAQNQNDELYQLVTEIEWVLEEVVEAAELDFAGLAEDIRRTIGDRRLLVKIHGFEQA